MLHIGFDQRGRVSKWHMKDALRSKVFERAKLGLAWSRRCQEADLLLAFLDTVLGTLIRDWACERHLEDAWEAFCGWKRFPLTFFNLFTLTDRTWCFVLTLCHTPAGFRCDHGVHSGRMRVKCAD